MSHKSSYSVALVWGLAFLFVGCSRQTAKVPELTPVSGVITLDGKPASDVRVIFAPKPGTPGDGGFGMSGADGSYKLTHRSGAAGVQAGQYDVSFSKFVMPDGTPVASDVQPESVGAKQALPVRYTAAESSNTQAVVTKDSGAFDFALKAK